MIAQVARFTSKQDLKNLGQLSPLEAKVPGAPFKFGQVFDSKIRDLAAMSQNNGLEIPCVSYQK